MKAHLEKIRNVKPGKPPAATEANTENAEVAPTVLEGLKRKNRDAPNVASAGSKKRGKVAAGDKGKEKEVVMPRIFYKRRSTLWDLPYWEKKKHRHNTDVMHMEKNICDSIIGTLLNIPTKTKDSYNARLDCEKLNVNSHLKLDPTEEVFKDKKALQISRRRIYIADA